MKTKAQKLCAVAGVLFLMSPAYADQARTLIDHVPNKEVAIYRTIAQSEPLILDEQVHDGVEIEIEDNNADLYTWDFGQNEEIENPYQVDTYTISEEGDPVDPVDPVVITDPEPLRDDQGRLINEDGHLIDEEGRLINEDGHLVDDQDRLINADGHLVDAQDRLINEDGHLIDDQGRLINEDGHLVNADGKLINEDGHLVDEEGRLVNSNGDLVNEQGDRIDEDGNILSDTDIGKKVNKRLFSELSDLQDEYDTYACENEHAWQNVLSAINQMVEFEYNFSKRMLQFQTDLMLMTLDARYNSLFYSSYVGQLPNINDYLGVVTDPGMSIYGDVYIGDTHIGDTDGDNDSDDDTSTDSLSELLRMSQENIYPMSNSFGVPVYDFGGHAAITDLERSSNFTNFEGWEERRQLHLDEIEKSNSEAEEVDEDDELASSLIDEYEEEV